VKPVIVAFAAALAGVAVAAQDAAPRFRDVVSEFTAAAIDRGVRSNDPPPEVRTGLSGAYLRGSMIVKFRPGTSVTAQRAVLALVDGASAPPLPHANFDIVSLAGDVDPEAAARRLSAQADVEYAQARYRVRPAFVPNDPFYSFQWNFSELDMERAWDINPGASSAVVVAVLDTGLAYRNLMLRFQTAARRIDGVLFPSLGTVDVPFAPAPDLAGPDRFVAPRDFIWDDVTPVDMSGHGTHVAGTIGQLTNNNAGVAGMAFNVRLMPVKVVDDFWDNYFNSPFIGTDDVVARGIRYAVDNGAQVLNMSIGRNGPPAPVVQDAIRNAVSRGAFVSVSAGNEGNRGNEVERFAEIAPQTEGMVAVGAIGRDRQRASYSSTGAYVELAAPGGDASRGGATSAILQQTYDDDLTTSYLDGPSRLRAPRFDVFAHVFFQGTSMAAPHVSGFAALLIQQGITSPPAIEAAMKRFATDLGTRGRDDEYGHGLINPRATLRGMGLAK
jgi:serine protease